jgi:hypothetical protein
MDRPSRALWLVIAWLAFAGYGAWPGINTRFLTWTVVAALSQIATMALLRNMEERNSAIGVTYSKSEIIQVALFGLVLWAIGCL